MKRLFLYSLLSLLFLGTLRGQDLDQTTGQRLQEYFRSYVHPTVNIGKCDLDSLWLDHSQRKLTVFASPAFAYQPFRPEEVTSIYTSLADQLPGPVCFYDLQIRSGGRAIEELIPNYYRTGRADRDRLFTSIKTGKANPWVSNLSRPYRVTRGLEGRHIALWQSHGRYYQNEKQEWLWQRPRLFCTIEDIFTQSFILPYVIPMLENAGAVVYTPRERDTQKQEVIVDNDHFTAGVGYIEVNSRRARWSTAPGAGFAQTQRVYQDGENPFLTGSARVVSTERRKNRAFAQWVPDIPEKGEYAVYVSYQTLPESVSDARYLVFHNGGVTEFRVNQQMGGGTWVYLGTFEFDRGQKDYNMVILSNESREKGVVSADAVRFGGGMGNIARGGSVSGLPRYLEAARYSAQWAGMPYEVYSPRKGTNDYADDISTRGNTINYLSGGSPFNPQSAGLGIPFELTLGLHTDAGYNRSDGFIGTLGIYTTQFNNERLAAGISRYTSRDLTDLILSGLQQDICLRDKSWTRRSMWDRNYGESRIPVVPATLIELLSHQNFADMRLGHDPHFKFTAGRSMYKSIVRYIATQYQDDYVIQPLPVTHFATRFGRKNNTVELSWQPQTDSQEPSARPDGYIVYTRVGYGGFDNGVWVKEPSYTASIEPGIVYSFRVTAVNRGGESFPSETLAAYKARQERGTVLVVNGFERLSGPAVIDSAEEAGFDLESDPGVPYLYSIAYTGAQTVFDRRQAGKEGAAALGYSGSELEGLKMAGNTFDYAFVHGKAIQAAGYYSFVSCSLKSLEEGEVRPEAYNVVDLILGLQKEDPVSALFPTPYYKTFSTTLQRVLTAYCQSGGNLLVSGAYVGSDMSVSHGDREFTAQVLKYGYQRSITDKSVQHIQGLGRLLQIPRYPNETFYPVTTADCLVPVEPAFSAFAYVPGGESAGIAYKGNYRTFVLGFPLESILSESDRATVMASVLRFFDE